MVKNPSKSILVLKCFKKIMQISGVCSLFLLQGSFQAFAGSDFSIIKSENLQQKSITGKIVDANNNPLIGVNVVEKGTTNGVMTGIDGKYSITVASGASILKFSSIG